MNPVPEETAVLRKNVEAVPINQKITQGSSQVQLHTLVDFLVLNYLESRLEQNHMISYIETERSKTWLAIEVRWGRGYLSGSLTNTNTCHSESIFRCCGLGNILNFDCAVIIQLGKFIKISTQNEKIMIYYFI